MNNGIRNALLAVIALAIISLAARNYSGAATATSTAPARHYYLTKKVLNGNQALTACASGYHFASFAEIMDPAVLTYNKTLGRTAPDDGAGPPAAIGWVRTGYSSNSNAVQSTETPTNCNLWTSGADSDSGETAVYNPNAGQSGVGAGVIVFLNNLACDNSGGDQIGVWCVEN